MPKPRSIQDGIKYTVVLPESDIQQLKDLANQKKISSINAGVREAVETYLVRQQQEIYKQKLQEAMKDAAFRQRNEQIEKAFEHSDQETEGTLGEW